LHRAGSRYDDTICIWDSNTSKLLVGITRNLRVSVNLRHHHGGKVELSLVNARTLAKSSSGEDAVARL
jgi:hypothetical protein